MAEQQVLMFSGVFPPIPWDELERRYLLAQHTLDRCLCGHASLAFLILQNGQLPDELTRCAPAQGRTETALALHPQDHAGHCATCSGPVPWPCNTVRALRGEAGPTRGVGPTIWDLPGVAHG